MWASSIFVHAFTHANRIPLERCRGGNGCSLGPLEKPIAERAVPSQRELTSFDDCVVRRCLIASDQERQPTQNISSIVETNYDFGWRCLIAGIDWGCARVKPGHDSSLSLTPFVLIRSVRIHALSPSQAIRNRVKAGVDGRRRSIDMVSSEYANFAPQPQHTR